MTKNSVQDSGFSLYKLYSANLFSIPFVFTCYLKKRMLEMNKKYQSNP